MEQLELKNSSHDLQVNCAISFYFRLYLVPHAYAARFDVTGNLEIFFAFRGELNKALFCHTEKYINIYIMHVKFPSFFPPEASLE